MYCLQHCTNCDKIMSPSEESIVQERSEGECNDLCLECFDKDHDVNFHDYIDFSEDYYDDHYDE